MTASLNIRNLSIDKRPTVRIRAITRPLTQDTTRPLADEVLPARLYGMDAVDARAAMLPGETPDGFFLRLLLFYQYANRYDSDTALAAAIARAEAR